MGPSDLSFLLWLDLEKPRQPSAASFLLRLLAPDTTLKTRVAARICQPCHFALNTRTGPEQQLLLIPLAPLRLQVLCPSFYMPSDSSLTNDNEAQGGSTTCQSELQERGAEMVLKQV